CNQSGCFRCCSSLVFLGLKNNDCCGNESCGKRFAMFTSIIFAAVGVLGAGYSFIVSAVAIHNGPMCLYTNGTTELWTNPFVDGDYLNNHTLLKGCKAPEGIVTWHLTLFSMLLVMGLLQDVLCAIQIINGLIGAICGDCCGVRGPTLVLKHHNLK
uniref:Transmembrane 4 L six family member 4 n=1 Tax=Salmo trutta TaxID=8032 RepID=A0A674F619_SALTR